MTQYAANTSVAVEKSRAEIESTLTRYGATSFAYGWSGEKAMIQFAAKDRHIRFVLALPSRSDRSVTHKREQYGNHQWVLASLDQQEKLWEQACRQRWRALALCIKAKLESVESEISTFEDEFLAHTVLPDGSTAGEWLRPQIAEVYRTGDMPSALPALGAGS